MPTSSHDLLHGTSVHVEVSVKCSFEPSSWFFFHVGLGQFYHITPTNFQDVLNTHNLLCSTQVIIEAVVLDSFGCLCNSTGLAGFLPSALTSYPVDHLVSVLHGLEERDILLKILPPPCVKESVVTLPISDCDVFTREEKHARLVLQHVIHGTSMIITASI